MMRNADYRSRKAALVSRKIVDEGEPVRFMHRAVPDNDRDSGWRMFSGFEDDAYNDDPKNIAIVPLSEWSERDEKVDALLDEPAGSAFERRPGTSDFEPVTDWSPVE